MRRRKEDESSSVKSLNDAGKPTRNSIPLENGHLVIILVTFRTINALLSFSSFVPDEYWQTLEVAHRMTFGYGYLTWEWHKPIRGVTHPLMYAALYKILAILNMDFPLLLIILPRVLHVPIAVMGDHYVMKLSSHLFGPRVGRYALLANVASWFTFYCITRTLSNSIETCLTPVIFYWWIQACEAKSTAKLQKYTRLYLLLMGISVLIRPTGAIMWFPIALAHFIIDPRRAVPILREMTLMVCVVLIWSILGDWIFYGELVIVQWNFLKFNVIEGHSALYGSDSWHWYFTEDVPVLLFTSLPLVIIGVCLTATGGGGGDGGCDGSGWWKRGPFLFALWELVFHSCLSHKEHRYVLPIVPIASLYAGYSMWWILCRYKGRAVRLIMWALLLANIPMALYFSLVHQRGTIMVMQHLRNDINENSSVLFLMPCHTTPLYSHIHKPISLKFLECPPPIRKDYHDVAKEFYSNPEQWLFREYNSTERAPTHLVLFDVLLPVIGNFTRQHYYQEDTQLFHTHFPESERYGSHVLVLKKTMPLY